MDYHDSFRLSFDNYDRLTIRELQQRLVEANARLSSSPASNIHAPSSPILERDDALGIKIDSMEQTSKLYRYGVEGMSVIECILRKADIQAAWMMLLVSGNEAKVACLRQADLTLTAYCQAQARRDAVLASSGVEVKAVWDVNRIEAACRDRISTLVREATIVQERRHALLAIDSDARDDDQASLQKISHCLAGLLEAHSRYEVALTALVQGFASELEPLAVEAEAKAKEISARQRKDIKKLNRTINRKIGMAIFGGLTLLAPMLIMVLHPGRLTALTTTSVFVLVVAMLLAVLMREAEPKDVVEATAAYAAVLVVFVGTSEPINGYPVEDDVRVSGVVVGCIAGILLLYYAIYQGAGTLAEKYPEYFRFPIPGGKDLQNQWLKEKRQKQALGVASPLRGRQSENPRRYGDLIGSLIVWGQRERAYLPHDPQSC